MNYIRALIAVAIATLCTSNMLLRKQVNRLDAELADTKSNLTQYQSMLTQSTTDNRVLQLKLDDFKQSSDSLIKALSNKQEELKIKDKQLKQVISNEVHVTDTVRTVISSNDPKYFTAELISNPLTKYKVSRVDSVLTCTADIKNRQDLFIYEDTQWQKKGFFRRLFSLNFKKNRITRYKILNTNPIIKTTETRIINISN